MTANIHDVIVEKMRALLIQRGHKVRTNSGQDKKFSVTGPGLNPEEKITYYPDVYTYDEVENVVTNIYEVETSESINPQSVEQWRKMANGSAKFYLVVPKLDLERTKQLVQQNNIKVVEYYTY